jgi:hypothetical protein
MTKSVLQACGVFAALSVLACSPSNNKEKAKLEAAVDSMTKPYDSTAHALDTTGRATIDTMKLGARATESILTKMRKSK